MKKHEVWDIYVQKNPKFAKAGSKITFTEIGIYQFFERTWDLAHSEGFEKGKELKSTCRCSKKKTDYSNYDSDRFPDIFREFFK